MCESIFKWDIYAKVWLRPRRQQQKHPNNWPGSDVNAIKNRQLQFTHFPLSSFAALLALPPPSRRCFFSSMCLDIFFRFCCFSFCLCNADRRNRRESLTNRRRRRRRDAKSSSVFCKYISKLKWIYKIQFAFLLIFHKASRWLVVNRIHSVELARLPRVRRTNKKKEFFVFANNYRIYTISVAIFVKKIRNTYAVSEKLKVIFCEVIICRSNSRNHRGSENSLKVSIQNLRINLLECK